MTHCYPKKVYFFFFSKFFRLKTQLYTCQAERESVVYELSPVCGAEHCVIIHQLAHQLTPDLEENEFKRTVHDFFKISS